MSQFNDPPPVLPIEIGTDYAALILAESILHTLIEKNLIESVDAIAAVQTTIEVTLASASSGEDPPERTGDAINALFKIIDSLAVDLGPKRRSRAQTDWERGANRDNQS